MGKKIKKISLIGLAVVIIMSCGMFVYAYKAYHNSEKITNEMLDKLSIDDCDNLMLVAHPDDETIWGGAHLIEDNYLVVCFTHANDKTRSNELKKSMEYSKDKYIMLDYPDKILNKRSNWSYVENDIKEDINCLINYKKWNSIVTHNSDGEYGHQHHKSLNEYVTDVYSEIKPESPLFYFGEYYKKEDIQEQTMVAMNEELLLSKKEMLSNYKSQSFIEKKFGHMYKFENFQEYK